MPERIQDTSWHFGAALALNSQSDYVGHGDELREPTNNKKSDTNKTEGSRKLGDFGPIWKLLGLPADLPPPTISPSPVSSEDLLSSNTDAVSSDGPIVPATPPKRLGTDTKHRPTRRNHVRKYVAVPEPALESPSKLSDTGPGYTVVGKHGRPLLAKNIMDDIKKEEQGQVEGGTTSGGDTSAPPLETPSEWERASQSRTEARKEKKRLRKERRKADRQATADLLSTGFALSNDQLLMPSPEKAKSTLVLVPKTPKHDGSPYRAAPSYKVLSREAVEQAQAQEESGRDVYKILKRESPKKSKPKAEVVSFSTPKHPATRSQVHTPATVIPKLLLAPQSAPPKVNSKTYPSVVQVLNGQLGIDDLMNFEASVNQSSGDTTFRSGQLLPQPARSPRPRAPPPGNSKNDYEKFGFHTGSARQLYLLLDLYRNFVEDKDWLASVMQMSNNKTPDGGIHVFVDASNIIIGFYEAMKRRLGRSPYTRLEGFEISFDSLVLLMERRRPVSKRILVGSAPELPAFDTARAVGYEVHVLEKVFKARELTDRQKFFRLQKGPITTEEPKWGEQGVDELLHLKMSDSILGAKGVPGTMVLATGDAAEAEYSDGFKKYVEHALENGWKVELVSWKKNISNEYRKPEFQQTWINQFRIIELDQWLDLLLDA